MTTTRDRGLDAVRRIVLDALAGRDAKVYLYGSCARGEARHSSDIDVAIDPATPLPMGLVGDIREALEESTIPYNVDVVDLGAADPEFRQRILRDAVEWRD